VELEARVKKEKAEGHSFARERKRKRLETATTADTELTEERPARRRVPTADDEVIDLED